METYSLENLTLREIKALRLGLDTLMVQGVDAMFLAMLQSNIQIQINEIEEHIRLESLPPIPPSPEDGIEENKNKKSTKAKG
jgi:hypothetical protein